MLQYLLGLLIRHALTIGAGILVNKGLVDASGAEAITGGVLAVAGIGLSALNKVKVVQKINDATVEGKNFSNLNK